MLALLASMNCQNNCNLSEHEGALLYSPTSMCAVFKVMIIL